MRKFVPLIVMLILLASCADRDAEKRAEARARFQAVMADIDQAGQGFIPEDKLGETTDLQVYRQEKLDQAVTGLLGVLKFGDGPQKMAAHRLLSDIHAASARFWRREAMSTWTGLTNRNAYLLSLLITVDRINSRANIIPVNERLLLGQLDTSIDQMQGKVNALNEDIADCDRRIAEHENQIQAYHTVRDEKVAQAQILRDKAFDIKGAQHYKLMDDAADTQRQANKTDTEAQKQQVRLEVVQSERAIYIDRRDSTQQYLEAIQEKRRATEARQREIREFSEAAAQDKRQVVAKLLAEMQNVLTAYAKQVEKKLDEADEKTAMAVKEAEDALKLASTSTRQMRQVHQLNLLTRLLDRVYVLTSQIQTAGDMGSTIGVLRERSGQIMPNQNSLFATTWDSFEAKQSHLISQVTQATNDAQVLASRIVEAGAPDDESTLTADRSVSILDQYQEMINSALLAP